MTCECNCAGYCERHKVNKTNLLHRKCQEGGEFWQAWEKGRGPGQDREQAPIPAKPMGVGSHLKRILSLDGYAAYGGCGCTDRAVTMNAWGPAKCRDKREEIVGWLLQEANKRNWLEKLTSFVLGDMLVKEELGRLVDQAIAAAEKSLYGPSVCIRCVRSDIQWSVVLTTAPREEPTLNQCVSSLRNCGWEPVVFAEPDSSKCNANTIRNDKRLGVWHNFLRSCRWALENTTANVIMTVQDDALFHPDSKSLAEQVLWPSERTGFVSLYTPLHYSWSDKCRGKFRPTGINRICTRSLWGACALVWPREVLEHFVEHPITTSWLGAKPTSRRSSVYQYRKENPHTIANSDTAIGNVMNDMQREMYFVDPSPVNHIASQSTIGHGSNSGKRNCGRCAKFDENLYQQVFEDSHENRDFVWTKPH
jgi:hypothetical protein